MAAWGEPSRPGLPPEGETGKGEIKLPCCRRHLLARYPWMPPSRALPPQALMATQKPEFPFKDTRMPVSTVFENFESGASIEDIMEWFDVTREQIVAVLEFAARSLDGPPSANRPMTSVDAHSL